MFTSDYVKGKNTNDAMSFRNNVLLAIVSSAPAEDDSDEIKDSHRKYMGQIKNLYEMKSGQGMERALNEMCKKRAEIFDNPDTKQVISCYRSHAVGMVPPR